MPRRRSAGWVDRPGSSFLSYCVEINEHFSFNNGNMSDYTIVAAADYVRSYYLPGSSTPMGAERANRLGQLMSYVASSPPSVDSASESTSLQLAIWNIIYDTDDSLGGRELPREHGQRRLQWLRRTICCPRPRPRRAVYDVFVLTKSNSQDFLLLRLHRPSTFSEVPEPASLALAVRGAGCTGSVLAASPASASLKLPRPDIPCTPAAAVERRKVAALRRSRTCR